MGRLKAVAACLTAIGVASVATFAALAPAAPARPAESKAGSPHSGTATTSLGPRVEGVVVDESGKPVAGARVTSLWTIDPKPVASTADGSFAIDTADTRRVNLCFLATSDLGARQGIFRYADMSGAKDPRTPVRIVLKPARDVTVTVVDAKGAPIPGADVFVLDLVFPVAVGKTDERGVAALRAPIDAMNQWVFAVKRGVGFDYFENYRTIPPTSYSAPPERARLVLNGVRTVRVAVVDSAGKPVPVVEIGPWYFRKKGKLNNVNLSTFPIKTVSDARGIAAFDWLPADIQGSTAFLVASPSYHLPNSPLFDAEKPDAELTVRVLRRTSVSGKVSRPDGSPAAGILVEAAGVGETSSTDVGSGPVRTGPDGTYAMDLAPDQSYMLAVRDDEWAAPSRSGMVVVEGQPRTDFNFTLNKGGVIRGRVTAGPSSAPSVGETISLVENGPPIPPGTLPGQGRTDLSAGFLRTADTDGDGRYAFRVGPGHYELRGPRLNWPLDRDRSEKIAIEEGAEIAKDFHLPIAARRGRVLRGVVRAKARDGAPIPDAVIVEETVGVRVPPVQGFADSAGRFELPHPIVSALIYARNPEGNLAGTAIARGDEEVTVVALPSASARGRVVDSAGKPRAGVRVLYTIVTSPEGVDPPIGAGQTVVTDPDGRFTALGLLVGGRCKLFAYNIDGGNSADQTIDVKDVRPIELADILLDPRTVSQPKPGER